MYDISDVSAALTIRAELRGKVEFGHVLSLFSPLQGDRLIDILSDLYMIKEVVKVNKAWNKTYPAWDSDIEYKWIWVEDSE